MGVLQVKDILNIEKINGLKIIAGETNLDNEVYNVNIIENPDSYEWFTAGDFILTTGYIFKDDVYEQTKFINELIDLNASGVGIKTKRFWDEIPKTIIDVAKAANFPVIEIPFKYSLAEVVNAVNDVMFQRENSALKKYRQIHNTFRKSQLAGSDYNDIAKTSSDIVNNTLFILNENFNLLSYYEQPENNYPLINYLNLIKGQKPFPDSFTVDIPDDPNKLALSLKKNFIKDNDSITIRIKPILYANKIYGYIFVWETIKKLEKLDYIALENAATTFALEIDRIKQIEEAKNQQRNDFFDNLIEGKIISSRALQNLAIHYGFNPDNNHLILVINFFDNENLNVNKITSLINEFNTEYNIQIVNRLSNILLFIDIKNKDKLTSNIKNYINEMFNFIDKNINLKYVVGVSNVCLNFVDISEHILLAYDVIKLTNNINLKKINYYEDLISYHLLGNSLNDETKLAFVNNTIQKLINHDHDNDDDLYNTLKAYYRNNFNISKTAKDLFSHRNTIIYRLNKIEKILNLNLDDSETNFTLQLAIKIESTIKG